MYTLKLKTRYSETDQGGIVHNSAYILYLENARIEFMQQMGVDINALEKEGFLVPVVSQSVNYLRPLNSLEEISVTVKIARLTHVRFVFSYEITHENEKVLEGQSEHCLLNKHFKPVRLPNNIKEVFLKNYQ